jgi:hypothetical protein
VAKRSRTRLAQPASAPATSGSRRSGTRRPVTRRAHERTFLERNGSFLLVGFVVLAIGAIAFLFISQPTGAYSCDIKATPGPTEANPTPRPPTPSPSASPSSSPTAPASGSAAPSSSAAPSESPAPSATAEPSASAAPSASPSPEPEPTARLGFTTNDLGRTHVQFNSPVKFAFCPPTSGDHYNVIPGQIPMPPQVYGVSTEKIPQYWIHNLEHGYVVLAYRCPSGVIGSGDCITQTEMDTINAWFDQSPGSPNPAQTGKRVVAVRFDEMDTRFALIAWDREYLFNELDLNTALTFAQQWVDSVTAPEAGAS